MASNPDIASSDPSLYASWNEFGVPSGNVVMKSSTDRGDTFSEPIALNRNIERGGLESGPKLATTENNMHAIWMGDTPSNVFLSTCARYGKSSRRSHQHK